MADIQDGWQHVKVVDWPKLSGVRFLLQVPIINFREMAAIFVILGNGWHPRWLTMAYVIETCAKYPLQQNWKKIFFRVSEVRFNLPSFNPRLKHLCVTFMHFKKVTKKISQNRLKISCVKSSENRLGNSSSHQLRPNRCESWYEVTDRVPCLLSIDSDKNVLAIKSLIGILQLFVEECLESDMTYLSHL